MHTHTQFLKFPVGEKTSISVRVLVLFQKFLMNLAWITCQLFGLFIVENMGLWILCLVMCPSLGSIIDSFIINVFREMMVSSIKVFWHTRIYLLHFYLFLYNMPGNQKTYYVFVLNYYLSSVLLTFSKLEDVYYVLLNFLSLILIYFAQRKFSAKFLGWTWFNWKEKGNKKIMQEHIHTHTQIYKDARGRINSGMHTITNFHFLASSFSS